LKRARRGELKPPGQSILMGRGSLTRGENRLSPKIA
jgi:hypothetical protein